MKIKIATFSCLNLFFGKTFLSEASASFSHERKSWREKREGICWQKNSGREGARQGSVQEGL